MSNETPNRPPDRLRPGTPCGTRADGTPMMKVSLLHVPVPPALDRVFGYQGDEQLVLFWWDPGLRDLTCYDGRDMHAGCGWRGWVQYVNHPAVSPHLLQFHFGGKDVGAQHALLIQRDTPRLFVVEVADGLDYVQCVSRYRRPAAARRQTAQEAGCEQFGGMGGCCEGVDDIDWDMLRYEVNQDFDRVDAMLAWLNQQQDDDLDLI